MRNRVLKLNTPQGQSELLKLKPVDLSHWEEDLVDVAPTREDQQHLRQINKIYEEARNKKQR